jgi:hypothetical protein
MLSCYNGHLCTAGLLIAKGADVEAKDIVWQNDSGMKESVVLSMICSGNCLFSRLLCSIPCLAILNAQRASNLL